MTSRSSHHFLASTGLPLPSTSSSRMAMGASTGFSHMALMPSHEPTWCRTGPSSVVSLLSGHTLTQRPQAEPLRLVAR